MGGNRKTADGLYFSARVMQGASGKTNFTYKGIERVTISLEESDTVGATDRSGRAWSRRS